jgi:alkylation response protein AidB-like acyl-CoA dehydrogenase
MGLRAAGLCRLRFDHVQVPRDALLGGEAPFDYSAVLSSARLAVAALGVGAAQATLDHVIRWRDEHGDLDASLCRDQPLALRVADAAIELEAMRLLVYRAASRQDRGRDVRREAQQARIHAAEYGMQIGAAGVQLLGGQGYSAAHPVERFYRDLRAVALLEGALLA